MDPDVADRLVTERRAARRQRDLEEIPGKVKILARDYIRAGGDPADLIRVIIDL